MKSLPHDTRAATLSALWVSRDSREVGLGASLVDAVVAWARGEGFARVSLEVSCENAVAIALYRRKGFRCVGVPGTFSAPRQHIHTRQMVLEL